MKRLLLVIMAIAILLCASPSWATNLLGPYHDLGTSTATIFGLNSRHAYEGLSTISADTDVSFTDSGSADYIDKTAGGFSAAFVAGDTVEVSGSTSNDGLYIISSVSSDTRIILVSTASLTTEPSGDSVSINEQPTICVVTGTGKTTTLSDSTRNGIPVKTGDFKGCYEGTGSVGWKDNTIILFEVSGTIDHDERISNYKDGVAIFGQTSPTSDSGAGGIFFKETMLQLDGSNVGADHHFYQHFRIGAGEKGTWVMPYTRDSITLSDGGTDPLSNIVFDHLTILWGTDGVMDFSYVTDTTISNCIIGEGLWKSTHDEGEHGLAGIHHGTRILTYKSLFIHNDFRSWEWLGNTSWYGPGAYINNLIYDPGDFSLAIANSASPDIYASIVGNVVIGGNESHNTAAKQFPCFRTYYPGNSSQIYIADNTVDADGDYSGPVTQVDANDWEDWDGVTGHDVRWALGLTPPGNEANIKVLSAPANTWPTGFTAKTSTQMLANNYAEILDDVGAFPYNRDSATNRLLNDIYTDSGWGKNCVEATDVSHPTWVSVPAECGSGAGCGSNYITIDDLGLADSRLPELNKFAYYNVKLAGSGCDTTVKVISSHTNPDGDPNPGYWTLYVSSSWSSTPTNNCSATIIAPCSVSNAGGWPTIYTDNSPRNLASGTFPGSVGTIPSNPHADAGSGWTNLEVWLYELARYVETGYAQPPQPPAGGASYLYNIRRSIQ